MRRVRRRRWPTFVAALGLSCSVLGVGTVTVAVRPAAADASCNGPVVIVDGGGYHSLALQADGTAMAWGAAHYDVKFSDRSGVGRYVPTSLMTGLTDVAAGARHTIGVKTDGSVWGAGANYYGQLGGVGLTGVTAVAADEDHSLALKSNGTVWVWGGNEWAQNNTPVQVSGLTNATAIAAGGTFDLARKSDGTVSAWGSGPGTPGLTGVSAIAAGWGHALALKSDGTVWAWGYNYYGQLGDGTTTYRTTPVQVSGLTNVTGIAAGFGHSLARTSAGAVYAWGANGSGQLGDGTYENRHTPVSVPLLAGGVTAIGAGREHSLAVQNGRVWTWGSNSDGQLGDGTLGTTRPTPARTVEADPVGACWSPVTLTASAVATTPGSAVSLTATAPKSVTGTGYRLQLFDVTESPATRVHSCATGTTCTAVLSQAAGAVKIYRAFVGPDSPEPPSATFPASNPVTVTWVGELANEPPSVPSLLSPVEGSSFVDSAPQSFRLSAVDADDGAYRGVVTVTNTATNTSTQFNTSPAASGGESIGVPPAQLPPGNYTWTAHAVDARGLAGAESPAKSFSVQANNAYPSDDCTSGVVADGFASTTYVKLRAQQVDARTAWLCVRVDNGSTIGVGGKLVVSAPDGGLPQLPTSDDNGGSCKTEPGNVYPGPRSIPGSIGDPADPSTYVAFETSFYQNAGETWACIAVTSAEGNHSKRVRVAFPGVPAVPTAAFLPDLTASHPGSPTPDDALPSSTCQAAANPVRLADMRATTTNTWLYAWQETPTRYHLCTRTTGDIDVGGRLTVDASGSPGVNVVPTTSTTDMTPCAVPNGVSVTTFGNPGDPYYLNVRRSIGTNPASLCITVGTSSLRMTAAVTGTLTPPAITWTGNPGTPSVP